MQTCDLSGKDPSSSFPKTFVAHQQGMACVGSCTHGAFCRSHAALGLEPLAAGSETLAACNKTLLGLWERKVLGDSSLCLGFF